jgi:hypothetical protein
MAAPSPPPTARELVTLGRSPLLVLIRPISVELHTQVADLNEVNSLPGGLPGPDQDQEHEWRTIYCRFCGHSIHVRVQCPNRFCPVCSRRRARRIRAALNLLFQKTKKIPSARFKMLTLSEPNCTELDVGIRSLVSSFRRLRQRSYWKNRVYGGAFVIEVTGRPNSWHPHLHIIMYSDRISWARLHRLWMKVSTGRSVWITNISLEKAKMYITKYITKVDAPAALLEDISTAVRRFRLFTRFGEWHSIVLPKLPEEVRCERCGHTSWMIDLEMTLRCRSPDRFPQAPPPRSSLHSGGACGRLHQ